MDRTVSGEEDASNVGEDVEAVDVYVSFILAVNARYDQGWQICKYHA